MTLRSTFSDDLKFLVIVIDATVKYGARSISSIKVVLFFFFFSVVNFIKLLYRSHAL